MTHAERPPNRTPTTEEMQSIESIADGFLVDGLDRASEKAPGHEELGTSEPVGSLMMAALDSPCPSAAASSLWALSSRDGAWAVDDAFGPEPLARADTHFSVGGGLRGISADRAPSFSDMVPASGSAEFSDSKSRVDDPPWSGPSVLPPLVPDGRGPRVAPAVAAAVVPVAAVAAMIPVSLAPRPALVPPPAQSIMTHDGLMRSAAGRTAPPPRRSRPPRAEFKASRPTSDANDADLAPGKDQVDSLLSVVSRPRRTPKPSAKVREAAGQGASVFAHHHHHTSAGHVSAEYGADGSSSDNDDDIADDADYDPSLSASDDDDGSDHSDQDAALLVRQRRETMALGRRRRGLADSADVAKNLDLPSESDSHDIKQPRSMTALLASVASRPDFGDGTAPFQCTYCHKRFNRKWNLTKHYRVHTGERPHACDVCGKAFAQKHDLGRHTLTHTGEAPFSCPQCDKRCNRKANLDKHIANNHGRR